MSDRFALAPIQPDADAARLAALETRLVEREAAVNALRADLQQLQRRYLSEIGTLYADLAGIETELVEAEIRAGLRLPPGEADQIDDRDAAGSSDAGAAAEAAGCDGQAAPSDLLKRVFRDLARTIHPDLAMDDAARLRRHSLMAEANRAYAERDADRLLLIRRRWEQSPESVPDDDPDAPRRRTARRMAGIEEKLAAIDVEFVELRNSAIARLHNKIEETRRQGWDLFAEMVMQVKADIARAKARLVAAQRMVGVRTEGRL